MAFVFMSDEHLRISINRLICERIHHKIYYIWKLIKLIIKRVLAYKGTWFGKKPTKHLTN